MSQLRSGAYARSPGSSLLSQEIARAAEPLPDLDDPAFARHFDRFGDARVVLLGEASHGTSEFYRARAAITRWLIENRGFTVVALDADWSDGSVFDARVRGGPVPEGAARTFDRFPGWTWRNAEFDAFLRWMTTYNAGRTEAKTAGIYGLDLYNLKSSMRAVIDGLAAVDAEAAKLAGRRYGGLTPWADDPASSGRLALTSGYARCEKAMTLMLADMLERQLEDPANDPEAVLDASRSARLVRDARAYYRAMYYGGAEAWNLRATHLFDTLDGLMSARGKEARTVVWAHNSHVGDARATEMGAIREERSLGQLCREKWGRSAALIGFGSHGGAVTCASEWDAAPQTKTLNAAPADSHEALAHATRIPRYLLDLRPGKHEALRDRLNEPHLQRFIGAVYRPETERWSHYVEARLPKQFDAYAWFDETRALTPLAAASAAAAES